MALVSLTLLGGFRAQLASGSDLEIRLKKAQALLAYLALHPGQSFLRDKLASLLWGDLPDDQARHNLRQTLFALRTALPAGAPILLSDDETVSLSRDAVEVDVITYERLALEATPEALTEAASLYKGDFLDGFVVEEASFEEWLQTERERLREVALEVLAKLLAHQMKGEAFESAIQTALRLLALDPLQETVHRTLMRLYTRQGRRAAALRQYQLCVDVLQRELGAEPDAATRQLYQQILPERLTPATARDSSALETPWRRRHRGHRGSRVALHEPLIGRALEMDRLRELLHGARRRRGTVAAIIGEAGVGKTRLVEELTALALRRDVKILTGRAYETTQALPFALWVDALRTEIVAELATAKRFDAVWAELSRLFPELHTPEPASTGDAMRLFEAVTRFIGYLAQREPLLLVLEDLHWADEMSLRLLAFLGRRLEPWRALFIVTAREEELSDATHLRTTLDELERQSRLVSLSLTPLSRGDTATLTRALIGSQQALPNHIERRVWELSEGNPFVVLETMRAVRDGVIPDAAPVVPLPKRVQDLVMARLDRLTDTSRHVVDIASVIGRQFDFTLLQHAAGLDDRVVAGAVEELVRCRVLHVEGEQLDFSHARIRDAALTRLLAPRRRSLNRTVARSVEECSSADLASHYASLAAHWHDGEVWDKAVFYLRHAATQATARSAHRAAVKHLDQALALLPLLPSSDATCMTAVDLRLELQVPLYALGEFKRRLTVLQELEPLVAGLGDQRKLAWVHVYLAGSLWIGGLTREAREHAERAQTLARDVDDRDLLVYSTIWLAIAMRDTGDYESSEREHRRVLSLDLSGDFRGMVGAPAVACHYCLSHALVQRGAFDEAIGHAETALRLAQQLDHAYSLMNSYHHLGLVHVLRGTLDLAVPPLHRGITVVRDRDIPYGMPVVTRVLGYGYALSGRTAEGIDLLECAVASFESLEFLGFYPMTLVFLAEAYALASKLHDAGRRADHALSIARARGDRVSEAWALRTLAIIALRGSSSQASVDDLFRESLAIGTEIGLRPLIAHCHAGLAKLYRQTAKHQQAQEYLTTATTMYREMGMMYWLEKAKAGMD